MKNPDVIEKLKKGNDLYPEIPSDELDIIGAVYNIETGKVDWV